MNPFFSIIIPVYNSQKYFKICLDSVLRQNFNNYEILIINDASRDGSKKICNDFQKISSKPETHNIKKSNHTGQQNFIFKRVMIFLFFCQRRKHSTGNKETVYYRCVATDQKASQ